MKANPTPNAPVILEGSDKRFPEAIKLSTIKTNECIEVTVRVRRKKSIEAALRKNKQYTQAAYETEFGASPMDMEAVEMFANENHLSVSEIDLARRTIVLMGKIKYFETAFQVHLSNYQHPVTGVVFRGRTGAITIPATLAPIIEGVFGLDNRPAAKSKLWMQVNPKGFLPANGARFAGYGPHEVAAAYGFPQTATGKGQCIAIIELDGGYRNKDIQTYFKTLGLPVPSVKAVSVGKGYNNPSTPDSADGEVLLDIEVAGAVAPGARIIVYFTENSDKGFLDAITTAIHDKVNQPSVISISWGATEAEWTVQSMNNFNEAFKTASLLGVTVCAAAGDQGSSDQTPGTREYDGLAHADFPSTSPYVLSCGGTRVKITNGKISSEVVWNDAADSATGGGVSDFFARPDYQSKTAVPLSLGKKFKGRGVPDVAGNASPGSGYKVLVDGQWGIIGGTSAVAPLMAGFFARVNERNGKRAGFIHKTLYAKSGSFCRDITKGNNITAKSKKGFKARKGWDACTGWGVLKTW